MTFAQPLWLWALAALPFFVLIFLRNERRRRVLLGKLLAARLIGRLAGTVSVARRRWRFALVLLGLAGVIVALARPQYGYRWEESKRRGRDLLIAIDTSRSMLATDLPPNRLTRAKLAAQDLISQLQGDRVGLIAFAGTAFLQAPLTVDYSAVFGSLQELDTEIIPLGGTNMVAAIAIAADAFGKGESDTRALVILTDGEELQADGVKAAAKQKEQMRIFTVGIGSSDGSLIPIPGEAGSEFVKDPEGQIVKSRLDEDRLQKIAQATGGFYLRLQSGRPEMTRLVREGLGKMNEQEIDAKLSRQPIERYQWPLSVGLVLLGAS
nr:VWA domain-containing protein [Verrucomicrobiota bacterium]